MKLKALLILALMAFAGSVSAQDYVLNAGAASGPVGGSADMVISLENYGGLVQGWSYGACIPAGMTVTNVANGAAVNGLNEGDGPDFDQTNLFADGWSCAIVIAFLGGGELLPQAEGDDPYEINIATLGGIAEGTADVCFCDTLGVPPVATVVVVGGASLPPLQNCGTVTGVVDQAFDYHAGNVTASYCPTSGGGGASVQFGILDAFPGDGTDDTQGFSMGVANDPAIATPTAINTFGPLSEPDFFGASTYPDGWTIGVVYSFLGGVFLTFDTATDVISVDYDAAGTGTTSLDFVDTLGSPAVTNVVVVAGQSLPADTTASGSLTFVELCATDFIRGDCNSDGIVNIADAIFAINSLFLGGPEGECLAACDSNADGMLDTSDATYTLNYRFLGGPAPSAPFPGCGLSDGDDTCLSFSACP